MLHSKTQSALNRPGVIAGIQKKKATIAPTSTGVKMSDQELRYKGALNVG